MFSKFKEDFEFGIKAEGEVKEMIEAYGRTVKPTKDVDVLDFEIVDKHGKKVWLELKTRRCNKDDYPDTMIGLNKLIEAFKRYDKGGEYTLFLFKFQDGTYILNPFQTLPRFDYRRGRFDRGDFDGEKAWIFYQTHSLKRIDVKSENSSDNQN